MGDVAQRPAELIAQMSAVAAAGMNFAHVLSSCPVFRDFEPARRPVVHLVNAFIRESWVKASAIRIAPLPATDRSANASVLLLAQPI
jgi:hypothetical protein